MTETYFTEYRDIIEWVRPHGGMQTKRVPLSKDAADVFDVTTKAGYTYSVEWIGNAYAFFISRDDLEMDIMTGLVMGDTSEKQRDMLSRYIARNTLDLLNRKTDDLIEMLAEQQDD